MQDIFFFSIANHNFTVVASDASYLKNFTDNTMAIGPGQTIDVLFTANQKPDHYYMAAKVYNDAYNGTGGAVIDPNITTAIIQYRGNYNASSPPLFPSLPLYNDTDTIYNFFGKFRSLANKDHPIDVPLNINQSLFCTLSINTKPCDQPNIDDCTRPDHSKLAASINNISYQTPRMDILEAYYFNTTGVFGTDFPAEPPVPFNYTGNLSSMSRLPTLATKVRMLEYNTTVEVIFQGTSLVRGTDHPMHLHGFSFYVVGWGFGNFNNVTDPLKYNLVDPPLQNTVSVPVKGWTTIRFKAHNPGVWFMHCHFERHSIWGMDTAFIVGNGANEEEQMLPRPNDMPPCN